MTVQEQSPFAWYVAEAASRSERALRERVALVARMVSFARAAEHASAGYTSQVVPGLSNSSSALLDLVGKRRGEDHSSFVVLLGNWVRRASRRESAPKSNATTYRTAATARGHPWLAVNQITAAPPNERTANQ